MQFLPPYLHHGPIPIHVWLQSGHIQQQQSTLTLIAEFVPHDPFNFTYGYDSDDDINPINIISNHSNNVLFHIITTQNPSFHQIFHYIQDLAQHCLFQGGIDKLSHQCCILNNSTLHKGHCCYGAAKFSSTDMAMLHDFLSLWWIHPIFDLDCSWDVKHDMFNSRICVGDTVICCMCQ